jgi:hypothetical protein
MDIAVEGTIYAMNGSDTGEIVDNYMRERDRLLRSYVDEVADILGKAQGHFLDQNPKLFLPLPSYAKVDSPDFRYENFMSKDMGTAVFGPKVEEERKKQATDNQPNRVMNPDSPVQRLNGFAE